MRRTIELLFAVVAVTASSGCLVIEKKAMVMVVPADSKEVHLYYVFEGISVLENKNSSLEAATGQLDEMKKDNFSFFVSDNGLDDSLVKHCGFEKLRFYSDPDRKRSLCADRRMTIKDRQAFAKELNRMIAAALTDGGNEEDLRAKIRNAKSAAEDKEQRKNAEALGVGALFQSVCTLTELADRLDQTSLKRIVNAGDEFAWVRFEPESVRLVIPATADCAKQIAGDQKSKEWLKKMTEFVEPIDLQVCDEGLAIVLGKKGQAIRLTYRDTRPHRPRDEEALAKYAGSPEAITLDGGKKANAEKLIEQFVREKTKKP